MDKETFNFVSRIVKSASGMIITHDKAYLMESLLLPLAQRCGFRRLPEFIHHVQANPDEALIHAIADAMTNNESMFFRDKKPFEQLSHFILPRIRMQRGGGGRIRIWSAACSTGQEPYSVAICLCEEAYSMAGFTFEIVATDISARVLDKAQQGIYSPFEVQRGVPEWLLGRYFISLADGNWKVGDVLREMVEFRQQNLIEAITIAGGFDVVLCRNVLMYFDEATRRDILRKISLKLNPGGILMVGSAEQISGLTDQYQAISGQHGLYECKSW